MLKSCKVGGVPACAGPFQPFRISAFSARRSDQGESGRGEKGEERQSVERGSVRASERRTNAPRSTLSRSTLHAPLCRLAQLWDAAMNPLAMANLVKPATLWISSLRII